MASINASPLQMTGVDVTAFLSDAVPTHGEGNRVAQSSLSKDFQNTVKIFSLDAKVLGRLNWFTDHQNSRKPLF